MSVLRPSLRRQRPVPAEDHPGQRVIPGAVPEACGAAIRWTFPATTRSSPASRRKTGLREAVICGTGRIDGVKAVFCVMDSRFMMASMGMAVGEKITRACEYATKSRLPLVIFAASGGARIRMQEGSFPCFRWRKTSAAVERHNQAGLLYISVMTHPTTGGGHGQLRQPGRCGFWPSPRL